MVLELYEIYLGFSFAQTSSNSLLELLCSGKRSKIFKNTGLCRISKYNAMARHHIVTSDRLVTAWEEVSAFS